MKMLFRFIALLLAVLQASCSQIDFMVINLPTHFQDSQVLSNVSYGPREDEKLDIYVPKSQANISSYPVVVFFYGGRWETGEKEEYAFVADALVRANFIVVVPNYRKYPDVKFPSFIEDAAAAIAWTSDHIAQYGGDPSRLNIAGHSAGAHIAALAVTDPHYLEAFHKSRSIVRSFVGMAGPYDYTPDEPDLVDMFGPPDRYPLMQVPHFVDGHEPPMFLMQGDEDTVVKASNMDKLAKAITARKGCVKTQVYAGINHAWLVGSLSWLGKSNSMITSDMIDFFNDPSCDRGHF